jgi:hypothetical protein
MKLVKFSLICAALLLLASPAWAQSASAGSVSGQVTDPQGASVPGTDVTLMEVDTKSKQATTTNDSGRYNFAAVEPGVYEITVSKTGFKVAKFSQQNVSVGLVLTLNVTLEVGSLAETVVVTAAPMAAELQMSNATVGSTLNLKDMAALPNLGRDASTLMMLQPGIAPSGAAGQGGGSVAGAYLDQNTFTIDGGNNSDDMAGNTTGYITNFTGSAGSQTNGMASGVVPTPIESVEEFKVNTFGQTADFNSSSGASISMVTKRGSDQWHGSGYGYYYDTDKGAANTWVNNHTLFSKGLVPGSRPACAPGTTLHSGDNNCVMPYTPIIPNHRSRFGFTIGGPATNKKVLGGKTYFFLNYEGFRYPGAGTFENPYPTPAMRAGVIQVPDANNVYQPYNMNPFPVTVTVGDAAIPSTVRTVTLPAAGAGCPTATGYTLGTTTGCDPRLIGLNPVINSLWSKFLPLPNDPLAGDGYNTQGFLGTIRTPLSSNNYVGRIDHDFNSKNRFFASLRVFKLAGISSAQTDVGGIFPGDTLGQYAAISARPQLGELLVFGLTSNLTSRMTNDVRVSYLWNWWEWSDPGSLQQFSNLGGALEIAPAGTASSAESATALIPYNVNNQSVRQRTWDGQDKMIRDDVTWVKGNHIFQFGGLYQHNFDYHTRTDNGSTIDNQVVYQIASQQISFPTGTIPGAVPTNQQSLYKNLASSVLGLVGFTQVIYTRTGSSLNLQPIGTQAVEQSTIPYYNVYGGDTWHIKPRLTLSYGVGYAVEMPPVEKNGAQVNLVYQSNGQQVDTATFLAQRKAAALAGQAYAPVLGFETSQAMGLKYPYKPFYGGVSPRVSLAWNPNFKTGFLHKLFGDGNTVIRGGYGRIYGRLNGVNQVLVPLLGPGLLQPVTCAFALSNGTCGTSVNLSNVFRIGTDGNTAPLAAATSTLPQPYFPGINGAPVAGDSTVLDPGFKPEVTDNIDFTIQRSFGPKLSIEVGYLGRRIKNVYQEVDIDSVPYMMTLGGQTFASAYANMYIGICGLGPTCANNAYTGPVQPFFENALTPGTGFCSGFANCTAAVASKQLSSFQNTAVSTLWAALNAGVGWNLGRTMLSSQATSINEATSLGFSNYNAGFITMRMRDWHGITAISNFTYGRALGTAELAQYNSSNTVMDPWNLNASYGPQGFDIKAIFNAGITYQPNSILGFGDFRAKKGVVGQLLKGWTIAPFFTYQSGIPIAVSYSEGACTGCQSFGEVGNTGSSDTSTASHAVFIGPYTGGTSVNRNIIPASGVGSINPTGLNLFADPNAVYNEFRRCILGYDTSCGGYGNLRSEPFWNMDAALSKDMKFGERIGATFSLTFTNVLNHFQPSTPSLSLTTPTTFGRITSAYFASRQMELGLKIHF